MQMAMKLAGGGILAILAVMVGRVLIGWLGVMLAFVAALLFKVVLLVVLVWALVWLARRLRRRPED